MLQNSANRGLALTALMSLAFCACTSCSANTQTALEPKTIPICGTIASVSPAPSIGSANTITNIVFDDGRPLMLYSTPERPILKSKTYVFTVIEERGGQLSYFLIHTDQLPPWMTCSDSGRTVVKMAKQ
jgi:hypothetical protein